MANKIKQIPVVGKVGEVSTSPKVRPQARMLDSEAIQANKAARARLSPEEREKLDKALCGKAWDGDKCEIVRLLKSGADVNARDKWRGTALRCAALYNGHKEVVELLIQNGAEVNVSLLVEAAGEGYDEIVQVLIDAGADVNAKANHGFIGEWWTALTYAAIRGHLGVVERLIDAGADLNARNSEGRTALGLALSISRSRHDEIEEARNNGKSSYYIRGLGMHYESLCCIVMLLKQHGAEE